MIFSKLFSPFLNNILIKWEKQKDNNEIMANYLFLYKDLRELRFLF